MQTRIRKLLHWAAAHCRTVIEAGLTCLEHIPEHIVVLNDIYGVVDLGQVRR